MRWDPDRLTYARCVQAKPVDTPMGVYRVIETTVERVKELGAAHSRTTWDTVDVPLRHWPTGEFGALRPLALWGEVMLVERPVRG